MTKAVCFKCGEIKIGAFERCPSCGANPRSDDELSASLAFNDHYFDLAMLRRIGQEIKAGNLPLNDAIRAKVAPGVLEAKRMIDLSRHSPSAPQRKRQPWSSVGKLRDLLIGRGREGRPTSFKRAASDDLSQIGRSPGRSDAGAKPTSPLAAHCYRISTPESLLEMVEGTSREQSTLDPRGWALALVIMSAAGYFIRSLLEAEDPIARDAMPCFRNANFDVLTAEAIVWIAFLIGQLWKADQNNDPQMYERIGRSTVYIANRYALDVISQLTGQDFKPRWIERKKLYSDALKERRDPVEPFASVLFLSSQRRTLEDATRPVRATDHFASEWIPLTMFANIFFSKMPLAYYSTFKSFLRTWPDRFPDDEV